MRKFSDYDLIVFDCDGVLLNSNKLKIKAMENALKDAGCKTVEVNKCTTFFASNFGKSRFYHIDYFVNNYINLEGTNIENFKKEILSNYSKQCESLYFLADITPFTKKLLIESQAIKYVASGSEQNELRTVFKARQLDSYFNDVLGSPEKKSVHLSSILKRNLNSKAVMIGDAFSDLEAAQINNIDFIFYSPFSLVEPELRKLCNELNYRVVDSFDEVIKEL